SGCTSEPVTITASPTIDTTVSESTGGLGDTLEDTPNNSSNIDLTYAGSVTIYLYAPGVTCHTDGSGTTVYSQTFTSVSTNGPFTTSPGYGPLFLDDAYPSQTYSLSLHDALPI